MSSSRKPSATAGSLGRSGAASRRGIEISSPIPRSPEIAFQPRDRDGEVTRHGSPALSFDVGNGNGSGSGSGNSGPGGPFGDAEKSPRTPTPRRLRKGKPETLIGLGLPSRQNDYDEYDLSPTHAYLEEFDSYPSSPDPSHTPVSPSMDSPGFFHATEKDPLGSSSHSNVNVNVERHVQFGQNQFPSNQYLAPTLNNPYSSSPKTPSGLSKSGRKKRGYKEPRGCVPRDKKKRRLLFFGLPIALVVIAGIAVGVVVALQHKPSTSSSSSGSGSSSSSGSSSGTSVVWNSNITTGSGTAGSVVTSDLGVQFTYNNSFGGTWAQDPYNPYHVSGRAQSWSPSLLEDWRWGQHIVRGVNLGGWLVTEPFICTALYEQYYNATPKAVDEYTLSQAMGDNLATAMEEHYRTFITEMDFAQIAAAGLNYVRIALGYWAIETIDGEPYLSQVSWQYFNKAIAWGRKYGIRILLDFHALPGSQNGWNHSGRAGVINWMYGVMGIANGQRSLEHIRIITEFISQDGIKQVVPLLGLVNEVEAKTVGTDVLQSFYYQAYKVVRDIAGYGSGNGPILLLHEGFLGVAAWDGFLSGADRLAMDQHPYLAFTTPSTANHSTQASTVCSWGGGTNDSSTSFGLTFGGEWSNAINDCGKWLDGVDSVSAYTSAGLGDCSSFEEWMYWTDEFKAGVKEYAMANMDALQNWFFWTWKIQVSTAYGYAPSPQWHYKLGLDEGWMPADPRVAGGYCKGIGVSGNQFGGTYPASATGSFAASSTPTINATELSLHSNWPPTSLGPSFTAAQVALFPTLTQTGSRISLPTPSHPSNATIGSGWAFSSDTNGSWTRVSGCDYPDEYNATAVSLVPTAVCTGSSTARRREFVLEPTRAATAIISRPTLAF